MVTEAEALPGRDEALTFHPTHVVLGTPLAGPWPAGHEVIHVAMGCFWGAERRFWELPGVYVTAVGESRSKDRSLLLGSRDLGKAT